MKQPMGKARREMEGMNGPCHHEFLLHFSFFLFSFFFFSFPLVLSRICDLLGLATLEVDLLSALQNGVILGLLVKTISPEKLKDYKFPSLNKVANVFQAAEHINK